MEKSIMFTLPITYILLTAIVLLHIGAVFFSPGKKNTESEKESSVSIFILYAFSGVNLLLHIALFVLSLFKSAPASEMLLMLMISAAVGSVCIGFKKKS